MSNQASEGHHCHAPVVHIGLGKTGTTTLQKHIFPQIPKLRSNVIYNDNIVMENLRPITKLNPSSSELGIFRGTLEGGRHFISQEGLVDWNPRNWRYAADRNVKLFGADATIIITVRKTEGYHCSLYQQIIHEGNVKAAENFFVDGTLYDRIEPLLAPGILTRYDVDSFDIERLVTLYKERFRNVLVVPMSRISEMHFLKTAFNLTEEERLNLCEKALYPPHSNKAFSKLAMRLTFKREKFLNFFGLMSKGSDFSIFEYATGGKEPKYSLPYGELTFFAKVKQFPKRATRRFFKKRVWRILMQEVVDKLVPYKKYELPPEVYRNKDLCQKNDAFIESLED